MFSSYFEIYFERSVCSLNHSISTRIEISSADVVNAKKGSYFGASSLKNYVPQSVTSVSGGWNRQTREKRKCLQTDSAEMSDIRATSSHLVWASTMARRYLDFSGTSVSGGSSGSTMSMWTFVNLLLGIRKSWISFLVCRPIFDFWRLKHSVHQDCMVFFMSCRKYLANISRCVTFTPGWH